MTAEDRIAELENRLGLVEDALAIRNLQHAYGYYLDKCYYDEVVDLFDPDGEVVFIGGVYRGRAGIARLYTGRFRSRFTDGHNGPQHGRLLDHPMLRTAPVALAYLDDPAGLAEAAMAVSALTHFDPSAGEACVLWSLAIRHAVLTGELNPRVGLEYLPADQRGVWADRLDAAERLRPSDFSNNGWVVEALQAAWCAIARTPYSLPGDDGPKIGVSQADLIRLASEIAGCA